MEQEKLCFEKNPNRFLFKKICLICLAIVVTILFVLVMIYQESSIVIGLREYGFFDAILYYLFFSCGYQIGKLKTTWP